MEKIKNHSLKTGSFVQLLKDTGNCFFVVCFRNIVVKMKKEIAIFEHVAYNNSSKRKASEL